MVASVLIGVLDSAAQAMIGTDAALTMAERALIDEPLARIMDRLSPAATEKIQTFADPVLLAFGLGLWGMRLYKLSAQQAELKAAQEVRASEATAATAADEKKTAPVSPRDNGDMSHKPLKPPELLRETQPI